MIDLVSHIKFFHQVECGTQFLFPLKGIKKEGEILPSCQPLIEAILIEKRCYSPVQGSVLPLCVRAEDLDIASLDLYQSKYAP